MRSYTKWLSFSSDVIQHCQRVRPIIDLVHKVISTDLSIADCLLPITSRIYMLLQRWVSGHTLPGLKSTHVPLWEALVWCLSPAERAFLFLHPCWEEGLGKRALGNICDGTNSIIHFTEYSALFSNQVNHSDLPACGCHCFLCQLLDHFGCPEPCKGGTLSLPNSQTMLHLVYLKTHGHLTLLFPSQVWTDLRHTGFLPFVAHQVSNMSQMIRWVRS